MRSDGCKSIVRIINRWGERVGKYQAGDKVVIRKDLIAHESYGAFTWLNGMEYLKEKDYVIITDSDLQGDYWIKEGWFISELMIQGLYQDK